MKTHTSFLTASAGIFVHKKTPESAINMPYYNKDRMQWEDYLAVFVKIHENLKNERSGFRASIPTEPRLVHDQFAC
jgi:hypothetical protein